MRIINGYLERGIIPFHSILLAHSLSLTGVLTSASHSGAEPSFLGFKSLLPQFITTKPSAREGFVVMAEREGFEPSVRFGRTHDFQSCAFDHSAISPNTLCHKAKKFFCKLLFYKKRVSSLRNSF